MDLIKEAFDKVKKDVDSLYFEIDSLKLVLKEVNWRLSLISSDLRNISVERENLRKILSKDQQTDNEKNKINMENIKTDKSIFKPLNDKNLGISIGNEGVPTDRQTNRQTDQQTQKHAFYPENKDKEKINSNPIKDAAAILESLDQLKKEIRLKFKRLTEQEVLIFSTMYQLEEEKGHSDYKAIADRLGLSQSSIRDYVSRLIVKGIPVEKIKINNKSINLRISESLKKVASLSTILELRDL